MNELNANAIISNILNYLNVIDVLKKRFNDGTKANSTKYELSDMILVFG